MPRQGPSPWLLRSLALAAVVPLAAPAAADILHLRDGTRHHGTLIHEGRDGVLFKITLADGAAVTRRFAAAEVHSIQRAGVESPVDTPDAERVLGRDELLEQMLREAYELLDNGSVHAALDVMQRVVSRATPERLAALSALNHELRGEGLDETLASLRLRLAMQGPPGRLFELRYASPFERPALGRGLRALQDHALAARFDERTVSEWVADPMAYAEVGPQTRALLRQARLANAALSARLRFDPELQAPGPRLEATRLRTAIAALVTHVTRLPGFGRLPADSLHDDPTLHEAERLEAQRVAESQPAAPDEPAALDDPAPHVEAGPTP